MSSLYDHADDIKSILRAPYRCCTEGQTGDIAHTRTLIQGVIHADHEEGNTRNQVRFHKSIFPSVSSLDLHCVANPRKLDPPHELTWCPPMLLIHLHWLESSEGAESSVPSTKIYAQGTGFIQIEFLRHTNFHLRLCNLLNLCTSNCGHSIQIGVTIMITPTLLAARSQICIFYHM